jgi:hypothetical protein
MTVLDTAIDAVFAWEALDSRGNPTAAAEVTLLGIYGLQGQKAAPPGGRLPGLPHISPAGQIIPSARER